MKRDEILRHIKELARSQGFYGRLLESIEEASKEDRENFLASLEAQNFNDVIDLILYLEA